MVYIHFYVKSRDVCESKRRMVRQNIYLLRRRYAFISILCFYIYEQNHTLLERNVLYDPINLV